MKFKGGSFKNHEILKHETKKHVLLKFMAVLLLFLGYFAFIAFQYGLKDGLFVTIITWSFFVLCTPIADAGFLIDFPFRLITRIKMLFSEIIVWVLAIVLNIIAYFVYPAVYAKTKLLMLFHHILSQPIPFWSIILVSFIGTFMSIQFGDELIDEVNHKNRKIYDKHKYKHKYFGMLFIAILSIVLYDFLLKQLGVELPI